MVSVTSRLTTGVTETAGGGGAPWAAATLHEAAILSAPIAAFQATGAGHEGLPGANLSPRATPFSGARLAAHSSAAKPRSRSASVTVGAEGGARWGHRRGGRARSERGNGNQRGQRQSCDQGFHDGFSMLADRLDISDALLGRRIANTPILSLLNMFWPTS